MSVQVIHAYVYPRPLSALPAETETNTPLPAAWYTMTSAGNATCLTICASLAKKRARNMIKRARNTRKASEQYEEARSQACENGRGFVVHYWNPDSERGPTTPCEDTLKEYATAYNGDIDVYIVYGDQPFSGSDTRVPVTYFYGDYEGKFSLLEIENGDWVTGVCEKAGKHVLGSSWEPVTELEEDE